jgi:hypothetical protein
MSSLRGDAGEKQGSLGRDEELHAALLVAPTAGKADDAHVLASHSAVENAPRISYVGATPTAQAYLCAALLINVGAAAGYVVANTARSVLAHHLLFTDGLYVLLATAFAVDALLYLLSWHGARPPPSRAATAAECLNIAPSLGYVVTASLYPWEPGDPELTGAVMIAEVVFSVVFLIDASLYLGVWWSDLADAAPRDVSRESSEDSPTESAAESELSAQGWEEGAWRLGRPLAPLRRRPSAIAARRRRWSRYAARRWPRCWLALHDLEGAEPAGFAAVRRRVDRRRDAPLSGSARRRQRPRAQARRAGAPARDGARERAGRRALPALVSRIPWRVGPAVEGAGARPAAGRRGAVR